MWGYAAEAIVGKHFDELFTPEDRAAGVPSAELERARRNGRATSRNAITAAKTAPRSTRAASPHGLDPMGRWALRRLRTT